MGVYFKIIDKLHKKWGSIKWFQSWSIIIKSQLYNKKRNKNVWSTIIIKLFDPYISFRF